MKRPLPDGAKVVAVGQEKDEVAWRDTLQAFAVYVAYLLDADDAAAVCLEVARDHVPFGVMKL